MFQKLKDYPNCSLFCIIVYYLHRPDDNKSSTCSVSTCFGLQNLGESTMVSCNVFNESIFTLNFLEKRGRVWRQPHERHAIVSLVKMTNWGWVCNTMTGHWTVPPRQDASANSLRSNVVRVLYFNFSCHWEVD